MIKTIIHALIACALGVALGLLSDGARAANVEMSWTISVGNEVLAVCEGSGTPALVCHMKYASTEAMALSLAQHELVRCADSEQPNCPTVRAYIRQRWGY